MSKSPISITKSSLLKAKPDSAGLGFGRFFTDHMFVAQYSQEKGWYDSKVLPYQAIPLDPGASVLHYGQA
ncbi:MAG: branched chain amino acid aminotransferase, partial [Proteobacteria bacterium]